MEEVQNYCDSVAAELGVWRDKIGDVVGRVDKVASGDKEKVIDQVRDLHMFTEELDNRIDRLKTECSLEYTADQIEMELKLTEKYIF